MPFKPVEQAKCPKCGKSVYHAEEILAGGYKWHKFCFKCTMCQKMLDSTTVAEHGAELYCKMCHGRKYGPKGVGFGIGAGALSMDTGAQFGNKEVEMTCVRLYRHLILTLFVLTFSVFFDLCNKLLDSTNVTEHEGALFCKQCHGRKFGPKGIRTCSGTATLDDGSQFEK